jgi:bifunctional non-homologous end joining protein LigD
MPRKKLTISQHVIEVTGGGKVLFPEDGITKGELIEYYRRVASAMVPYMEDRPLIMERYPDGIDQPGIFQESVPRTFPAWIKQVTLQIRGKTINRVMCDDPAILVYLASQACVAIHTWLSKVDLLDHPDRMVFDLNPSEEEFEPVGTVAILLRDFLEQLELTAFLMTTGSSGLHVVVPLDRSEHFQSVRSFARNVVRILAEQNPELICPDRRKEGRGRRVCLDVSNNAYGQAVIAPYSVRPIVGAPVAKPIYWSELSDRGFRPRMYAMKNVGQWLDPKSDPWAGMLRHARGLKEPRQNLETILVHSR